MFYTLHRLVKWFFMALGAACLLWLYSMREALEPLYVWYDVYENGGIQKTQPLPQIQGEGIMIFDGHTFQMKSEGRIYSVRLTGFDLPEMPFSPDDLEAEKKRRRFLREAVVGQPVQVAVSYSNNNSLLGVVYAGGTNLNTYFVTSGLSRFNREYVKSTPRDLQYKFFAAVRATDLKGP